MNTELWTILGSVVTIAISNGATWFFTRKKYNSEVDGNVIENMEKSLDFYIKLSNDNKARLDETLKKQSILEQENQQLRKDVSEMKDKMYNLMENICMDLTCSARQRMPKEQVIIKSVKKSAKKSKKNIKPAEKHEKN